MRISDWSSDVCSSDLVADEAGEDAFAVAGCLAHRQFHRECGPVLAHREDHPADADDPAFTRREVALELAVMALAIDRKSVGEGKSMSVSVTPGGWRYIKKTKKKKHKKNNNKKQ